MEAVLCREQTGAPGETDDVFSLLDWFEMLWESVSKNINQKHFAAFMREIIQSRSIQTQMR